MYDINSIYEKILSIIQHNIINFNIIMDSCKKGLLKPKKSWIVRKTNRIIHWYKEWDRMYDKWFDAMIECGESID